MSGKRRSIKARIQVILNTHKNDIKLIMKNIFVCENRFEPPAGAFEFRGNAYPWLEVN